MAPMITSKFNSQASNDKPFFLSPKIRFNKIRNLSLTQLQNESGFTLVELIVVVMMIGILSSIAIPQFMSAADKAKQKEASAIVASMIKAATAYQTEYGALPLTMGDISEYAKFQKCTATGVGAQGGQVCKTATPVPVLPADVQFYSTSGHYNVEMQTSGTPVIFQVKANPNGGAYSTNGSAVVGCYNPTDSVSRVLEYSAQQQGTQAYPTC